jgi:hypothetical protein
MASPVVLTFAVGKSAADMVADIASNGSAANASVNRRRSEAFW